MAQFTTNDADWLGKVGVVADDHGYVEVALIGIHEEVGGEIDVGAFFFGFYDERGRRPFRWGMDKVHTDFALEEFAVVNGEIG